MVVEGTVWTRFNFNSFVRKAAIFSKLQMLGSINFNLILVYENKYFLLYSVELKIQKLIRHFNLYALVNKGIQKKR